MLSFTLFFLAPFATHLFRKCPLPELNRAIYFFFPIGVVYLIFNNFQCVDLAV